MSDNGVTSAETFRAKATKVIGPLPVSGAKVKIRKIRHYDILAAGQLFASMTGIEGDEKAVKEQVEKRVSNTDQLITLEQYFEIVSKGMIDPKMVTGDYEDVVIEAGMIHRSDLEDDDLIYIGNEIMAFSGYGGSAEAEPFSEEPGASDPVASHGQRVRTAAKRPVEKQPD